MSTESNKGVKREMLGIKKLTCENCAVGCVTDNPAPVFEFYAESDEPGVNVVKAELSCNGWTADVKDLPRDTS